MITNRVAHFTLIKYNDDPHHYLTADDIAFLCNIDPEFVKTAEFRAIHKANITMFNAEEETPYSKMTREEVVAIINSVTPEKLESVKKQCNRYLSDDVEYEAAWHIAVNAIFKYTRYAEFIVATHCTTDIITDLTEKLNVHHKGEYDSIQYVVINK